MNYSKFIVHDPAICGGEPIIKGTRVTLRTLLASLAEGCSEDEIIADFPTITHENLRAVIAFAAASAEADLSMLALSEMNIKQKIDKGLEAADLGKTISHEEVKMRFEKISKKAREIL